MFQNDKIDFHNPKIQETIENFIDTINLMANNSSDEISNNINNYNIKKENNKECVNNINKEKKDINNNIKLEENDDNCDSDIENVMPLDEKEVSDNNNSKGKRYKKKFMPRSKPNLLKKFKRT